MSGTSTPGGGPVHARDATAAVFAIAVHAASGVDTRLLDLAVFERLHGAARVTDIIDPYAEGRFAVRCDQPRGEDAVYGIAERLEASLARCLEVDGQIVPVRLSFGVGVAAPGQDWQDACAAVDRIRERSLAWTESAKGLSAAVREVAEDIGGDPVMALLRSPDLELLGDAAQILGRHVPAGSRRLAPIGDDGVVAILPSASVAEALWLADGARAAAAGWRGARLIAGAARVGRDGRPRLLAASAEHLGAQLEACTG